MSPRRPPREASSAGEPLRVEVRPAGGELERDLARLERLARLLDSQFSIGRVQFGWDGIVGLVPVVGDATTAALSLYPLYLAGKHGLGSVTIGRMLGNIGLDLLVGAVPVVGDVFDVAFKANRRNLEIFRKAALRRRDRGAG